MLFRSLVLGVLAIFLKWWITVIIGTPLFLGIIALFFKGWPSFRLDRMYGNRTVVETRAEIIE